MRCCTKTTCNRISSHSTTTTHRHPTIRPLERPARAPPTTTRPIPRCNTLRILLIQPPELVPQLVTPAVVPVATVAVKRETQLTNCTNQTHNHPARLAIISTRTTQTQWSIIIITITTRCWPRTRPTVPPTRTPLLPRWLASNRHHHHLHVCLFSVCL